MVPSGERSLGNHVGLCHGEIPTPLLDTEILTSGSHSRKRRKYSRRSDAGSVVTFAGGLSSGRGSPTSVASQFAEALSSSCSSGPDSIQYQPSVIECNQSPQNIFQKLGNKFNIRRNCLKLKKADIPQTRAVALHKIVRALNHQQDGVKLFTKLVRDDSNLQSRCLEVALLRWDLVVTTEPSSSSLHTFSHFVSTLISAAGETSVQDHLLAFTRSHLDGVFSSAVATRVHTLFELLRNRSTTIWCHMFSYFASILYANLTFDPGEGRTLLLTQLHALIRTAPVDVLQSTALDISRALESITKYLYPEFVGTSPLWQKRGVSSTLIALFDLIKTLGGRDLWPEVTSPLRWMVKPGVGSALIQIATNVPPDGKDGDGFTLLGRCLALAALQVMHKFETVKREIVAGEHADEWFTCLFTIMLGKFEWSVSETELESLVGSKKIYPHEDAYDIISCFPRSKFATHLTTVMEDACRAGKEECFTLLEPLAWLTRMEDEELNDAMLSAGAFAFFERMARLSLPVDVGGLDYLVECEKKGDALICFRNMFDIMSPAQIARYTTLEMMKLILKLRDDPELPSRVTRRASDAYDAFIGDTKEKMSMRRTDEEYRRLWKGVGKGGLHRTTILNKIQALTAVRLPLTMHSIYASEEEVEPPMVPTGTRGRRRRRRRRYSRRSDAVSMSSGSSGGVSRGSAASRFMEWLSSTNSSTSSVKVTPSALPSAILATKPANAIKNFNVKREVRRHIDNVTRARNPSERRHSTEKLLDFLHGRPGAINRFFKLLTLDPQVRKECLEAALLDSDNGVATYTHGFILSESSASARFIQMLVQAVDEPLLRVPFSDFINSADRSIHDFITAARVHFLFQRLSSRSVMLWRDVLVYSSSVTRRDLASPTRPPFGYDKTRTVKQLHVLLRTAPPEALRMAIHEIDGALDTITDTFCPVIIHFPCPQVPDPVQRGIAVTVLDLIHTLGEKDVWPELNLPLRWAVKPGIGPALLRIAVNDPPVRSHRGDVHQQVTYPDLLRCLALASLQGMLEFDMVKQDLVAGVQAGWFGTLFDIMLARVQWDVPEHDLKSLIGSKKIYPYEGAYDVLSYFPQSTFTAHLAIAMEGACRAGKEECLKLLEPLAWLTRMGDEKLNASMLSAGVFAFFERMARSPLPGNVNGLDYVFECEKKGDALICFRNMFSAMSPAQIVRYTTVEMMKLILKLRDDRELPSR
ncbi:hypothetical protein FRB99_008954, partial [Tulasnella sp. 403]